MAHRIERLAAALERRDALALQQCEQAAVDRLETCGDPFRFGTEMVQSALEVVEDLQQRHDQLALPRLRRALAVPLHAPAVIVKVRQRAQVAVVLPA